MKEEININEIISVIWDRKMFVFYSVLFFTLISVVISLVLPFKYISVASLRAAESSNQYSNKSLSLDSLSIPGLSSVSDSRLSYLISVIKSRDFFNQLAIDEDVLNHLIYFDRYDFLLDKPIFIAKDEQVSNFQSNLWFGYKAYIETISTSINEEAGLLRLGATHESPKFVQELINKIVIQINSIEKEKEQKSTERALIYLNEKLLNVPQNNLQSILGNLIEAQLQKQMLANISDFYSLEYVDRPFIPIERSSPQRKRIVITTFLSSIFLSILFALILHFIKEDTSKKIL